MVPFAVESYGAKGKQAQKLLLKLADASEELSAEAFLRHASAVVSVALQCPLELHANTLAPRLCSHCSRKTFNSQTIHKSPLGKFVCAPYAVRYRAGLCPSEQLSCARDLFQNI